MYSTSHVFHIPWTLGDRCKRNGLHPAASASASMASWGAVRSSSVKSGTARQREPLQQMWLQLPLPWTVPFSGAPGILRGNRPSRRRGRHGCNGHYPRRDATRYTLQIDESVNSKQKNHNRSALHVMQCNKAYRIARFFKFGSQRKTDSWRSACCEVAISTATARVCTRQH